MKLEFKGISVEELSYKINRVQLKPDTQVNLNPQFARQLRKIEGNDKLTFVALSMKIESTEAEPKPFDMKLTMVGIFEVEDLNDANDQKNFNIEATRIIYPYMRASVTNLTVSAYAPPLYLSAATPVFPEDRDKFVFSVGDVN